MSRWDRNCRSHDLSITVIHRMDLQSEWFHLNTYKASFEPDQKTGSRLAHRPDRLGPIRKHLSSQCWPRRATTLVWIWRCRSCTIHRSIRQRALIALFKIQEKISAEWPRRWNLVGKYSKAMPRLCRCINTTGRKSFRIRMMIIYGKISKKFFCGRNWRGRFSKLWTK